MLIKIACPCGHVGVVSAESLPRDLKCWRCGASRHVDHDADACIVST
jgi:hypothetical protein